jgi:choline-sulfatase
MNIWKASVATVVVIVLWWTAELAWVLGSGAYVVAHSGVAPLGAAALTLGLFALVAALAVGGIAALVDRVAGGNVWRRALGAEVMRSPRAVGSVFAALTASAVFLGVSYAVGYRLVLDLARPDFTAVALAGSHLVLAVGAVALFALLRIALARPVRWMAALPVLGWPLQSAWRVLAAVLLACAAAAGAWLTGHPDLLPYLPWEKVVPAAVAVTVGPPLAVLLLRAARRHPRRARVAAVAALGVWLAVSTYGALALSRDGRGLALFEEDLMASALGTRILNLATDFDRDGHRPVLGGGDCAPFDPRIHPGAVDIPDDGVDQDCDGRDLTVAGLVKGWGTWDHAVPERQPKRPPIVLVTVEALAARRIHAFGYPRETTPHLDALFKEGVLFENAFSHGPSTRLSFPALFTGRWLTDVRRRLEGKPPYPVEPGNDLMAEVLARAGYRTAAVVPDAYFTSERWPGIDRGFERVELVERAPKQGHLAREVNDRALRVIDASKRGKPLFLWVHHWDTHPPHATPEGGMSFGDSVVDRYDAELRHMDASLGALVHGVRERLGPETIVVITGDHGVAHDAPRHAGRHYGFDLHTVTLHVPLLWLGPHFVPRRIAHPCSHLDILPTLANLLRLHAPLRFRGESLVPELFGERASRPAFVFHQFFLPDDAWRGQDPLRMVSVRTPEHQMVLDRRSGRAFLWNWATDYLEEHDLAGSDDPELQAVARTLEQLLSAFVYEVATAGNQALGPRIDDVQPRKPPRQHP